jgi:exopolysaccharide biosynthesis polyprenyl glycosylphosphotransferase
MTKGTTEAAVLTDENAMEVSARRAVLLRPRGSAARRYAQLGVWVAVTDALALVLAVGSVWVVQHGLRPMQSGPSLALAMLFPLVYLGVFAAFRLYNLSRLSPAEEFRRIIAAVSAAVSGLVVFAFWFGVAPSRFSIGVTWAVALLLTLVFRRLWHLHMGRLRYLGALTFNTLIVGTNEEARHLANSMRARGLGFRVVGYVPTQDDFVPLDGLPVYGDITRLGESIEESGADCVFVASTAMTPNWMAEVTRAVRGRPVDVRVSANVSGIMTSRLMVQQMGTLVTLSLKPVRLTGAQALAKRSLDVVLASIAFVLTLPLWGLIALAVRLDTRGPVLYRQERIGKDGRAFSILKFRTMVVGAEAMLEELKELNEATGPLFKLRKDPRVTRVGAWLRNWSLDELPQLLNVLKGEMSLVGPRPPLPDEVVRYEDWHHDRLVVRPGITGLWQVRGRSQLPFDDYVRLDLYYIENWSVAYDLFILFKTIPAILLRKGAY